MNKKILVISLSTNFAKSVTEILAKTLGKYFLSIDDFIEYTLFNSKELLKKCGKEYYLQREQEALQECLNYDNMIYSCSYDVFVNNGSKFQNFEIFYPYLPKDELDKFQDGDLTINQIAFEDRNNYLLSIATKIAYSKDINLIVEKILNQIRK